MEYELRVVVEKVLVRTQEVVKRDTLTTYEPMVLVADKLNNNISILQTELRYREGHET